MNGNYLLLMGFIMLISFASQAYLKSTFGKFARIRNAKNLTGAEVARGILDANGLQNVAVELTPGMLSDHYDPSKKMVFLSEINYAQSSLAALAVAAHEVGHAIQDAQHYPMLNIRARLFPALSVGANIGPMLIMGGLMLGLSGLGGILFTVGLIGLAAAFIFHLITLPTEFDASARALKILESGGYLTHEENQGAKSVLTAAALTYVAAAIGALATLLYYLGFSRRRED